MKIWETGGSQVPDLFHVVVDRHGGCSIFAESGHEVVSLRPDTTRPHWTTGTLDGQPWTFEDVGIRRLRIVGRPSAGGGAALGYVGSSTSGVILVDGGRTAYRFVNGLLGRSRVEGPGGSHLVHVRLHLLPRFRTSYRFVGTRDEAQVVIPILGVLACLTVITSTRPSLHWTSILAGAPERELLRLKARMDRGLNAGDDVNPALPDR